MFIVHRKEQEQQYLLVQSNDLETFRANNSISNLLRNTDPGLHLDQRCTLLSVPFHPVVGMFLISPHSS